MPFGVSAGFGFGLGGGRASPSVVASGLIHDWKLDEEAAVSDRMGARSLTSSCGQALDFSGDTADANWLWDTGATDFQMAFVNGKTSASIGAVCKPDTVHNGHIYGGWYGASGTGLPLAVTWRDVGGVGYIQLGFWKTPFTNTQCYYRAAGGAAGSWKRVWWQLDSSQTTHLGTSAGIPARVRCWLNGVEVDVSWASGGTWDEASQLASHNTVVRNRLSFGSRSSDGSGGSRVDAFNGMIQRGFVTSELVTQGQAETLLTGHPYQFPTLGDGHIHVLDYGTGTVATCYRDGTSLTAYHAGGMPINTAWVNATAQQAPCPQTLLRRHGTAAAPGMGGSQTLIAGGGAFDPTAGFDIGAGDWTYMLVCRSPEATSLQSRIFTHRNTATPQNGFTIWTSPTNGHVYIYGVNQSGGNGTSYIYRALHEGDWVTIAIVSRSGSAVVKWAKASQDVLSNPSTDSLTAALPMGGSSNQRVRMMSASIALDGVVQVGKNLLGRVVFYNRALTDDELLVNHKAMRRQYV